MLLFRTLRRAVFFFVFCAEIHFCVQSLTDVGAKCDATQAEDALAKMHFCKGCARIKKKASKMHMYQPDAKIHFCKENLVFDAKMYFCKKSKLRLEHFY